jgi:hypothetical protein
MITGKSGTIIIDDPLTGPFAIHRTGSPDLADAFAYFIGPAARHGYDEPRSDSHHSGRHVGEVITDPADRRGLSARPVRAC